MVWLAFLSAWATIVDQSITIKLASIYKPSVIAFITPTIENKGSDQKAAKNVDEKHQFMSTAIAEVASFYQNIDLFEKMSIDTTMVNDKAKEIEHKFQVSEQTNFALTFVEQRVRNVGFAIRQNHYVMIGALCVTGSFNNVSKEAGYMEEYYIPNIVSQEVAKIALYDDLEESHVQVFGLPIQPFFAFAVLCKDDLRKSLRWILNCCVVAGEVAFYLVLLMEFPL